jgi:general stress protein 26
MHGANEQGSRGGDHARGHSVSGQSTGAVEGSLDELKKLLHEFGAAMLTTVSPEGLLRARPMAIQKDSPEVKADLWFVTSIDSAKIQEIARSPKVGVTCLRGKHGSAYVSISAHATVWQDRATVKRLWQPDWKMWWPEGPDDPQIAFVLMQVERAEYWEPAGGVVRVLFDMLKGLVKHEPADAHLPSPKRI